MENIIETKKELISLENRVYESTKDSFDELKEIFKKLMNSDKDEVKITEESNNIIEGEIYGTKIGLSLIDGVALLDDDKLIRSSQEIINDRNYKEILLDEDTKRLLRGMIIIFTEAKEFPKKILVGRFFVSEKEISYQSVVGWQYWENIDKENANVETLEEIIKKGISNSLFEGTIKWDNDYNAFDDISDLSSPKKIGFHV